MALSIDEVKHIARLARVSLSDAEVAWMHDQLTSILDHFEVLSDIDTDDVSPTAQSFELTNVERPDIAGASIARDTALAGAPRQEDGYYRVRAVLD